MKGNRHTEPQRGVSERNRRKAAALSAEMGSLSLFPSLRNFRLDRFFDSLKRSPEILRRAFLLFYFLIAAACRLNSTYQREFAR